MDLDKGRFVRVLPVGAGCSERNAALDPPFLDHAAYDREEPRVTDAAGIIDVGFCIRLFRSTTEQQSLLRGHNPPCRLETYE
jgi:hypothetical protein